MTKVQFNVQAQPLMSFINSSNIASTAPTRFLLLLPFIDKTQESCSNAGESVSDHFANVRKMISLGSDAERQINDVMLTRYPLCSCELADAPFIEAIENY